MIFDLTHRTRYAYQTTATLCHSEARLTPRSFESQTCLESRLTVTPKPAMMDGREDHFGNHVAYFSIQEPHDALEVVATSRVKVLVRDVYAGGISWEAAAERIDADLSVGAIAAREYRLASPFVPRKPFLEDYASTSFKSGRDVVEALTDLNSRIHAEFEYVPGYTEISTPLAEVYESRKGVCQDFAHFAVGCVRAVGIPARYVSGYLETVPPPGMEKLQGADASHAWFAAYVPGAGWVDFDPTNDLVVSNQHVTLAWGRDFSDATPLKGVVSGGGTHRVSVAVDVERDEETLTS